jgi:hypothetical protein
MADRQALHAYLTSGSHATWQHFAEENGVSMTGLLEAMAQTLATEIESVDGDSTQVRPDWVKAGRQIDAGRRRRGGA